MFGVGHLPADRHFATNLQTRVGERGRQAVNRAVSQSDSAGFQIESLDFTSCHSVSRK